MGLLVASDDIDFRLQLSMASVKLVIVDFTASWCGPCKKIGPFFESLSIKYPNATFIKVDVDECAKTAASYCVTAMPTFIFLRNKVELERLQGASETNLENLIIKHYVSSENETADDVKGQMDLSSFILKTDCECLNENDTHPYTDCLNDAEDGTFLASDCDEQLILALTFVQSVRLHSIRVKAPRDKGPKTLKIFINQPNTLDFDQAADMTCAQELQLTVDAIEEGKVTLLHYVKFQNVHNVQIFVRDNQENGEITQINHLALYGLPVGTTNMNEFKRVAGKKGEGH